MNIRTKFREIYLFLFNFKIEVYKPKLVDFSFVVIERINELQLSRKTKLINYWKDYKYTIQFLQVYLMPKVMQKVDDYIAIPFNSFFVSFRFLSCLKLYTRSNNHKLPKNIRGQTTMKLLMQKEAFQKHVTLFAVFFFVSREMSFLQVSF